MASIPDAAAVAEEPLEGLAVAGGRQGDVRRGRGVPPDHAPVGPVHRAESARAREEELLDRKLRAIGVEDDGQARREEQADGSGDGHQPDPQRHLRGADAAHQAADVGVG